MIEIHEKYPEATWLHGGAEGFDTQVWVFAGMCNIPVEIHEPDYTRNPQLIAPLIRNREMVDECDLVVACYDGRQRGGTFFTIKYAKAKGKEIIILKPMEER